MNANQAISKSLTVYTDGSSRGNPGPGGWACIIMSDAWVTELAHSESHTTNNRMELSAVLKALDYIWDHIDNDKNSVVQDIVIHADSQYVIKGITEWIEGWIKRGWRTADKKPVLNQDLWQSLYDVTKRLETSTTITWTYVQGHSGHAYNERCDELATMIAQGKSIDLYQGSRQAYHV